MDANYLKGYACTASSCLIKQIGMKHQADKLSNRAEKYIDRYVNHAEKLKSAVEANDTQHAFGGAKTKKEHEKIIKKCQKKIARYDETCDA